MFKHHFDKYEWLDRFMEFGELVALTFVLSVIACLVAYCIG